MFVPNDFVWHRFVAQICTKMCVCPGICANMHDKATQTKPLATINGTISRNMPTNLEPKRLKSKLDLKRLRLVVLLWKQQHTVQTTVPKNSTLIFRDLVLGFGRETLDCG